MQLLLFLLRFLYEFLLGGRATLYRDTSRVSGPTVRTNRSSGFPCAMQLRWGWISAGPWSDGEAILLVRGGSVDANAIGESAAGGDLSVASLGEDRLLPRMVVTRLRSA